MAAPDCPECGEPLPAAPGRDTLVECVACKSQVTPALGLAAVEGAPDEALQQYLASRYDLGLQAGTGGASTVYRARRRADGRDVVIKVHTPATEAALERFRREARMLAELKHPRIVRLLEVLELGDQPGLVMEWLPGGSLRGALERDKKLPVIRAVSLARDILEGLDVCHAHGVIHRDVKPENILIGPDGRALLADLGVARQQDAGDSLTRQGSVVGTPRYMAPEQLRGDDHTAAVDIYAAALVLHEMLSARPAIPFEYFPQIVLFHHDGKRPARLRELDPALPQALDDCVHALLAPDPAARPPSARAAIAILDSALRLGSSAAIPRPALSRKVSVPARPPAQAAANPLAQAAAKPPAQAAARAQAAAKPAVPPATAPAAGAPRRSRAVWLVTLVAMSGVLGMGAAYLRRPRALPPALHGLRVTALEGRATAGGRALAAGQVLAFGDVLSGDARTRLTLGVDDRELAITFPDDASFSLAETPRGRRLLVSTGRIGLRGSAGQVELRAGGSAIVSVPGH